MIPFLATLAWAQDTGAVDPPGPMTDAPQATLEPIEGAPDVGAPSDTAVPEPDPLADPPANEIPAPPLQDAPNPPAAPPVVVPPVPVGTPDVDPTPAVDPVPVGLPVPRGVPMPWSLAPATLRPPVPAAPPEPSTPEPSTPEPSTPEPSTPEPEPLPPVPSPVPLQDTGGFFGWPVVPVGPAVEGSNLGDYLPTIRRRGFRAALGLFFLALVARGASSSARAVQAQLRDTGWLPSLATGVEILGRALFVILAIGAAIAIVPESLVPALPFVAVAGAIAFGWSLRDALPDMIAWAMIATEGRVRRDTWIEGVGYEGRVEAMNLRTTWVVDPRGARTSVPNRVLLQHPVRATTDQWPETEVRIRLPAHTPAGRSVLREAALLSPWTAPDGEPEIGQDPTDSEIWTVRTRLLDGRYRDRFEGSFPERVQEVLASRSQV